ncbi:hypothetical protein ACWEKR_03975 [Nocardia sp. NPDC004573]
MRNVTVGRPTLPHPSDAGFLRQLSAEGCPAIDLDLWILTDSTDYTVVEGHADGRFTAPVDPAASMPADDRYVRRAVSVVTTVDNPTLS